MIARIAPLPAPSRLTNPTLTCYRQMPTFVLCFAARLINFRQPRERSINKPQQSAPSQRDEIVTDLVAVISDTHPLIFYAARQKSLSKLALAHFQACERQEKFIYIPAAVVKRLAMPLVVFVFLGDHRILSASDVERSLFGMTAFEVSLEDHFPKSVSRNRVPVGGLLLPDEYGDYHHRNLSAVISCDWFDTLNPQDRGKRLHCLVLHNWPGEALSVNAFRLFPQIIWDQTQPDVWKPQQTINANTVAKFTLDGGIECHGYTPNTPW